MTTDSTRSALPPIASLLNGSTRQPIEIDVRTGSAASYTADVVAVGVYADHALTPAATTLDVASGGTLSRILKRNDLDAKAGSSVLLYDLPEVTSPRVLVVSLGERKSFGDKPYREALAGTARALNANRAATAAVTLADVHVPGRSAQWRVETAARRTAPTASPRPAGVTFDTGGVSL